LALWLTLLLPLPPPGLALALRPPGLMLALPLLGLALPLRLLPSAPPADPGRWRPWRPAYMRGYGLQVSMQRLQGKPPLLKGKTDKLRLLET